MTEDAKEVLELLNKVEFDGADPSELFDKVRALCAKIIAGPTEPGQLIAPPLF